jgi:hypothetical protein
LERTNIRKVWGLEGRKYGRINENVMLQAIAGRFRGLGAMD